MKISCCKDFNNPVLFGPHLEELGTSPEIQIPLDVSKTFLIHGYHSPEKEAGQGYLDIEKNLSKRWVEYYWPGGAIAIDFPLAVHRATETGWRLRDVMKYVELGYYIDVQTHSLGARVVLEALKYGNVKIRHLILSAPAVNNDCFDKGGEFEEVPKWCKSVNVFYSTNDPILAKDYPLSPTNLGRVALGHSGPSILTGTVPGNLRKFDYSSSVTSHGQYRYLPQYYKDWEYIVATN